ncbi:hypothetical protein BPAE_0050g00300 [Botrytis paeoniae]|uniref:Uncharacterized protein n=1 Tax=Botrytis paeoniae TaxID=278948 RepID=A0A4Z1FYZ0_9HELO|nr:hypothetical protein BPAE_0050g00300 [Botrytis paeoniae]
MSQGPKFNKNYHYPYVADQPSPSLNLPMNNKFPASYPIVNAPAPWYSQNFPHPSMNRQSSSAYPPTHAAYSTSASTSNSNISAPQYNQNFSCPSLNLQHSSAYSPSSKSSTYTSASTGNSAAENFVPAATYSRPVPQTHHRVSRPSSTAQDTKRDSGNIRDQEVSGRSNRSISGSSSPTPTSAGSSSRSGRCPRVDGLYETTKYKTKLKPLVPRAARKKETAEKQAVERQSTGRQTAESPTANEEREEIKTPEQWREWQTEGERGG